MLGDWGDTLCTTRIYTRFCTAVGIKGKAWKSFSISIISSSWKILVILFLIIINIFHSKMIIWFDKNDFTTISQFLIVSSYVDGPDKYFSLIFWYKARNKISGIYMMLPKSYIPYSRTIIDIHFLFQIFDVLCISF